MSIVLLLLYIVLQDGRPVAKLEQIPTKSLEACKVTAKQRGGELEKDPSFVEGLYAGCAELTAIEAKK